MLEGRPARVRLLGVGARADRQHRPQLGARRTPIRVRTGRSCASPRTRRRCSRTCSGPSAGTTSRTTRACGRTQGRVRRAARAGRGDRRVDGDADGRPRSSTILRERRIPVSRINSIADIVADPQFQARDMIVAVDGRPTGRSRSSCPASSRSCPGRPAASRRSAGRSARTRTARPPARWSDRPAPLGGRRDAVGATAGPGIRRRADGYRPDLPRPAASPSDLGITLMHEHIFVRDPELERNLPGSRVGRAGRARAGGARASTRLHDLGIRTVVDLTVPGLGRDVRRVAARGRTDAGPAHRRDRLVHASVAAAVLPAPRPGRPIDGPDELAELFVRDIEEGIAGTTIRAGDDQGRDGRGGDHRRRRRGSWRPPRRRTARPASPITTHSHPASRNGLAQQRVPPRARRAARAGGHRALRGHRRPRLPAGADGRGLDDRHGPVRHGARAAGRAPRRDGARAAPPRLRRPHGAVARRRVSSATSRRRRGGRGMRREWHMETHLRAASCRCCGTAAPRTRSSHQMLVVQPAAAARARCREPSAGRRGRERHEGGAPAPTRARSSSATCPEPEPGPDDVRIAVGGVGLCGSDLAVFTGTWTPPRVPVDPGPRGLRDDRRGRRAASPSTASARSSWSSRTSPAATCRPVPPGPHLGVPRPPVGRA